MPHCSSGAGDVSGSSVGLWPPFRKGSSPVAAGAAGRYSMGRLCPPGEWMSMRWNALEAEALAQLCPELLEMGTSKKFSKQVVSCAT